jgi:hypothetical protein
MDSKKAMSNKSSTICSGEMFALGIAFLKNSALLSTVERTAKASAQHGKIL